MSDLNDRSELTPRERRALAYMDRKLDALRTPHDPAVIERIAQAIYASRDARVRHNNDEPLPWDAMPAFIHDSYRDDARAALSAIDALYDDEGGDAA